MITTTENQGTWSRWCAESGVDDVYWSWEHLALWSREWEAKPLGVRWQEDGEVILHPVLLVPLDRLEGGGGFFDVRTAYDFGGPRHVGSRPAGSMATFETAWGQWTRGNRVVTEFLRLHPTALPFLPSWSVHHADNHVVDLTLPYEEIRGGYHSSWRNCLRKAEALELPVEATQDPEEGIVDSFLNMYRKTMGRRGAPFWFHFREDTLRRFLTLPEAYLVTVGNPEGKPIAHATILASGPTLFYHLSCSDPDGLSLEPNRRLLDYLVRWGRGSGFRSFHLGGGSPSLGRFKKHMGTGTVPYHVVKQVWDPGAYAALCLANQADPQAPVFPPYIERLAG